MAWPNLGEWTNIIIALGVLAQAVFAFLVWRVSAALKQLQRDQFVAQGPLFRVYFNGFQNRPKDPKNEMLTFWMTIANEGRSEARLERHGIVVLGPPGKEGETHETFTIVPIERVEWGPNSRGEHSPFFPDAFAESDQSQRIDFVIPKHDARAFIAFLPANGGYEKWKRVRLYAAPIGGPEASHEMEWNLFWLMHARVDAEA